MITGRALSYTKLMGYLCTEYRQPITLVETGCVRSLSDDFRMGDGWSTYHWLKYCTATGSKLWSVDIDPHAIQQAKSLVELFPPFIANLVTFVQGDSVQFLRSFPKKIDLLFLDSYDYCGDEENVRRCHEHSLNEIKAAWHKLQDKCYILIDDVFDEQWNGKGKLTIPHLLDHGFRMIYFLDRQALLGRSSGA